MALAVPVLLAAPQEDLLTGLANDLSGRTGPLRCEPAAPSWDTPPGQRFCVWEQGNVPWAPAILSGRGASNGPLELLVWATYRKDTSSIARLRDSLGTAFVARGLKHYECRSGVHRWQMPGLAVELHPGAADSTGQYRTGVYAVINSKELPKIWCKDVPDLPTIVVPPTRRG